MPAHVYTRWDKVHLQRGSECGDARDVGTDFTPPSILPMSVCAPHFHSGSDGAGCILRQCLVLFPALPSEPLGGRPAVFIFLLPITHMCTWCSCYPAPAPVHHHPSTSGSHGSVHGKPRGLGCSATHATPHSWALVFPPLFQRNQPHQ